MVPESPRRWHREPAGARKPASRASWPLTRRDAWRMRP